MENDAANIILGEAGPAETFILKYGWFTFKLKIKPLEAQQIVRIGGQSSTMKDVDITNDMFAEMLENSSDLWIASKVIAIATNTRFRYLVAKGIMRLPLVHIETLLNIVKRQSDPERFFFIMALVKGLNKLKKADQAQL